MKIRDAVLVSVDHTVSLTGNIDVKAVAELIGINSELEEYPYIPQIDSMIKRNGKGFWYDMEHVEESLFERFIFTDFLKNIKRYIPKVEDAPPIFLVNEKYHLMIVIAPREEVLE